jgi:hypothetical protein
VPVFLERYLLPLAGTLTVLVVFTNPMNFDWTQRITGGLALLFAAYFVAHTAHRLNGPSPLNAEISAAHVLQDKNASTPAEQTLRVIPPAPVLSFGTQMVLADGRVIIVCSPENLQTAHKDNTVDRFKRLLGGRWVKISGTVRQNYGDGLVFLTQDSPIIVLHFAKGWIGQLAELRLGSIVTIRGKVTDADSLSINLAECELL